MVDSSILVRQSLKPILKWIMCWIIFVSGIWFPVIIHDYTTAYTARSALNLLDESFECFAISRDGYQFATEIVWLNITRLYSVYMKSLVYVDKPQSFAARWVNTTHDTNDYENFVQNLSTGMSHLQRRRGSHFTKNIVYTECHR